MFLTQTQLAERVGVTQSAVGQWERDETIPALRVRQTLAGALGVHPHDFFADIELRLQRHLTERAS